MFIINVILLKILFGNAAYKKNKIYNRYKNKHIYIN